MLVSPVLFLVFNRPALAEQVLERIKQAKPPRLYIAADGPRKDHAADEKLCEKVRMLVDLVDWDCKVETFFRKENLGCRIAVSTAIDWFFENEEGGIILEEDCLPDISFFDYCETLLRYYKDNERIMAICGNCFQKKQQESSGGTYYFSKYFHSWGWASWRRAWIHYDGALQKWPTFRSSLQFKQTCVTRNEQKYWIRHFDALYNGNIDSWAYQMMLACWQRQGLVILPRINLVENIGFTNESTHTGDPNEWWLWSARPLNRIEHPKHISIDTAADRWTDKVIFSGTEYPSWPMRMRRRWWRFSGRFLQRRKANKSNNTGRL